MRAINWLVRRIHQGPQGAEPGGRRAAEFQQVQAYFLTALKTYVGTAATYSSGIVLRSLA